MNLQRLITPSKNAVKYFFQRNMGISAVMYAQVSDPIQKLFLEKLRAYAQKSKAQGGGIVDATPEQKKALEDQLNKLKVQFGGGKDVDMTKFPTFQFQEPTLDPINTVLEKK